MLLLLRHTEMQETLGELSPNLSPKKVVRLLIFLIAKTYLNHFSLWTSPSGENIHNYLASYLPVFLSPRPTYL